MNQHYYLTDDMSLLTNPVEGDPNIICLCDAAQGTWGRLTTRPIWAENDPLLNASELDGPGPFLASGWALPEGGCINFVPTSISPPKGSVVVVFSDGKLWMDFPTGTYCPECHGTGCHICQGSGINPWLERS